MFIIIIIIFQTERETSTYLINSIISTLRNGLISGTIGRRNKLVQLAVCVISGQPQSLAISWVLATTIVLLLSCVYNRNAICHDGECGSVLGEGNVVGDAGFPKGEISFYTYGMESYSLL